MVTQPLSYPLSLDTASGEVPRNGHTTQGCRKGIWKHVFLSAVVTCLLLVSRLTKLCSFFLKALKILKKKEEKEEAWKH